VSTKRPENRWYVVGTGHHCSACRGLVDRLMYGDRHVTWSMTKWDAHPHQMDPNLKDVLTRGQSNLTKSASREAHSPVMGHRRGSKVVPLNSWLGFPISVL